MRRYFEEEHTKEEVLVFEGEKIGGNTFDRRIARNTSINILKKIIKIIKINKVKITRELYIYIYIIYLFIFIKII